MLVWTSKASQWPTIGLNLVSTAACLKNLSTWALWASCMTLAVIAALALLNMRGHLSRNSFFKMLGIPMCMALAVIVDVAVSKDGKSFHPYARHILVGAVTLILVGFLGYASFSQENAQGISGDTDGEGSSVKVTINVKQSIAAPCAESCLSLVSDGQAIMAGDSLECSKNVSSLKETAGNVAACVKENTLTCVRQEGQDVYVNETTLEISTMDSSTENNDFAADWPPMTQKGLLRSGSFFGLNQSFEDCTFPVRPSEVSKMICPPDPCPLPRGKKRDIPLPPVIGEQPVEEEYQRTHMADRASPEAATYNDSFTQDKQLRANTVGAFPQMKTSTEIEIFSDTQAEEEHQAKVKSKSFTAPPVEPSTEELGVYSPETETSLDVGSQGQGQDAERLEATQPIPATDTSSEAQPNETDEEQEVARGEPLHEVADESLDERVEGIDPYPPALAPKGVPPSMRSPPAEVVVGSPAESSPLPPRQMPGMSPSPSEQSLNFEASPQPGSPSNTTRISLEPVSAGEPPIGQSPSPSTVDELPVAASPPESVVKSPATSEQAFQSVGMETAESYTTASPHVSPMSSPGPLRQSPRATSSVDERGTPAMSKEDSTSPTPQTGVKFAPRRDTPWHDSPWPSPVSSPHIGTSPASSVPTSPSPVPKSPTGSSDRDIVLPPPVSMGSDSSLQLPIGSDTQESVLSDDFSAMLHDGAASAVPCGVKIDGKRGHDWVVHERMKKVIEIVDETATYQVTREEMEWLARIHAMSNRPLPVDMPVAGPADFSDVEVEAASPGSDNDRILTTPIVEEMKVEGEVEAPQEVSLEGGKQETKEPTVSKRGGWFDNILPYFIGCDDQAQNESQAGDMTSDEAVIPEESTHQSDDDRSMREERESSTDVLQIEEASGRSIHVNEESKKLAQTMAGEINIEREERKVTRIDKASAKVAAQGSLSTKPLLPPQAVEVPGDIIGRGERLASEAKERFQVMQPTLATIVVTISSSLLLTIAIGTVIMRYAFFYSWTEMITFSIEVLRRLSAALLQVILTSLDIMLLVSTSILGRGLVVWLILCGIAYCFYVQSGKKTAEWLSSSQNNEQAAEAHGSPGENEIADEGPGVMSWVVPDESDRVKQKDEGDVAPPGKMENITTDGSKTELKLEVDHMKLADEGQTHEGTEQHTAPVRTKSFEITAGDVPTEKSSVLSDLWQGGEEKKDEEEHDGILEATADMVGSTVEALKDMGETVLGQKPPKEHIKIIYERNIPEETWGTYKNQDSH